MKKKKKKIGKNREGKISKLRATGVTSHPSKERSSATEAGWWRMSWTYLIDGTVM